MYCLVTLQINCFDGRVSLFVFRFVVYIRKYDFDKVISGVPQGGRNIKLNLHWSISTCLCLISRGDERENCMSSSVSITKPPTPQTHHVLTPAWCVRVVNNFSGFEQMQISHFFLSKPFFKFNLTITGNFHSLLPPIAELSKYFRVNHTFFIASEGFLHEYIIFYILLSTYSIIT